MIIIKLKGGLGNQMFQYAFGRSVSERMRETLKLDVSGYYRKDNFAIQSDTKRTYLLDKFNIRADLATDAETAAGNPLWRKAYTKIRGKLFGYENAYAFYPKNLTPKEKTYAYLEGFWNSEKYFKDISDMIRQELTLKKPLGKEAAEILSLIKKTDVSGKTTVSLHVRRTDYVTMNVNADLFGTCTAEYYRQAVNHIIQTDGRVGIELFIFSDDIPWIRENLAFPCPMHFVSRPGIADYEEIPLMSACRFHIIANSSFSWWGAWLDPRPDAVVIAPKHWLADPKIPTPDVIPERWIRL